MSEGAKQVNQVDYTLDAQASLVEQYPHEAIVQDMSASPKMHELLKSIIVWAVELLQADAGEIFLWDSEREHLELSISHGFVDSYSGAVLGSGEGLAGRVFSSGQPIIIADYHSWEGRIPAFESAIPPSTTMLSVPLIGQQRTIGVLALDADARKRHFDQNDVRLVSIFAKMAAAGIENARLYEHLQDRSHQLRVTLEREVALRTAELARRALQMEVCAKVSREITSILDLDKLLSCVVDLISAAFGLQSALIFLVDQKANRLVLRAASGEIGRQLESQGMHLQFGRGSLNGEAACTNQAVLVNDVSQEPRYMFVGLLANTKSEVVLPLRVGDCVVGTLDVQSDKPGAFCQRDVMVLQSLGDQVAIAIENARLYKRARLVATAKERQRLARELHDSVTQSLYSMTLLAETGRRAVGVADTERVASYLVRMGEIAQQALKEMRLLVYELRPPALEHEGLVRALQRRLNAVEVRAGMEARFLVEDEVELAPVVEEALYRVGQEALNNVLKHSAATLVTVRICLNGEQVEMEIVDNGQGFDPARVGDSGGMGLVTMRERVDRLGGALTILSVGGEGTTVKASVVTGLSACSHYSKEESL